MIDFSIIILKYKHAYKSCWISILSLSPTTIKLNSFLEDIKTRIYDLSSVLVLAHPRPPLFVWIFLYYIYISYCMLLTLVKFLVVMLGNFYLPCLLHLLSHSLVGIGSRLLSINFVNKNTWATSVSSCIAVIIYVHFTLQYLK